MNRLRTLCFVLAGAMVDCTCRDGSEESSEPSAPPVALQNPTPNATPTPSPTPAVGAEPDAVAQQWLTANNLTRRDEDHRLFDVNGDGMMDIIYGGGLAVRGPSGFTEQSALLESTEFAAPVRTARGVVLAFGKTGHDTDHSQGQTTSDTWMDWSIYLFANGATRDLMADRFDEDRPIPMSGPFRIEALADGSLLEVMGPYSRALHWTGETLAPATCWRQERWASAQSLAPGCAARPAASVHLRDVDQLDRAEDSYSPPPGTSLTVIAAGNTRRGEARLFCVSDGSHEPAWAFVLPGELSGCPSFGP